MKDENKVSIVALKEISSKLSEDIGYIKVTKTISTFVLIMLIISMTLSQVNHQERIKKSNETIEIINEEIKAYDKVYNQLKKMELTILEPERG